MADLKITGRMKVKTLKDDFKSAFGATLRVYNGSKFAEDSATVASIRKGDAKGGEFSVKGNTKVDTFEKKVKELFGVKVQVALEDDSALSSNSSTLSKAGSK